jgi:hypothetical protein
MLVAIFIFFPLKGREKKGVASCCFKVLVLSWSSLSLGKSTSGIDKDNHLSPSSPSHRDAGVNENYRRAKLKI